MGRLEGDLSLMPLADTVIWLANRRMSGQLVLEQKSTRKEFVIEHGSACRALSNDAREYFGQFLIHLDLITADQLERAYSTHAETSMLLGRILVMIGLVPEEHVIQALRIKIAESMLDAFRWRHGRFTFDSEASSDIRRGIEVAVPLLDLHREGIARADMWAQFRRLFPDSSQPLKVDETRVPSASTSETLEERIIDLARNGLDMESITLELHATDFQIASRLIDLHRIGAVRPNATTPAIKQTPRDSAQAPEVESAEPSTPELSVTQTYHRASEPDEIEANKLRTQIPVILRIASQDELRSMTARERYILGRIDGRRSVQSIIQLSPLHDLEALNVFRHLRRTGYIQL